MKHQRLSLLATPAPLVLAFAFAFAFASSVTAETDTPGRPKITRRTNAPNAVTTSFSAEVPLIQRYSPPNSGNASTLVLNAAHSFNVTLTATNQHNGNAVGAGLALPQTDTFGYFSFPTITGNPSNPEVFVKILDARGVNGNFWVFYGHLTDLIYDITVTENATGHTKTYHKDAGVTPGGAFTTDFPPRPRSARTPRTRSRPPRRPTPSSGRLSTSPTTPTRPCSPTTSIPTCAPRRAARS